MAARLATQQATDDEIASLTDLAADFDKESAGAQVSEYSQANIRFHQRILELSKCTLLKTIADDLLLHMRAIRNRAMTEGDRARRSVVDHTHIVEAIQARDANRAADLVRDHTMRLHDHVRQTWAAFEAAAAPADHLTNGRSA
jgi:DNA-binding GntR family transcriptional regulator